MEDAEKVDNDMSTTAAVENNLNSNVVKNCTLCGCSTPAVKCDKCGSQTFCLSCDDMYHRHPKRRFHLRKAVDSIWNSHRSPRFRRRTELPGDPSKIPIPPPRTKKRHFVSNVGGMFKPSFEIPGYKGYWSQKRGIESQPKELDPNYALPKQSSAENPSSGQGMNDVDSSNVSAKPSDSGIQSLQRRSSADSPSVTNNPSSPVHVFVPGSPIQLDPQNTSSFGYCQQLPGHGMNHSMSATDLTGAANAHPPPHPLYPFPAPMHPFFHPQLNPYAPFNCPQCLSASWSNLMSSNMAQYHQHHHVPQQLASPGHPGTLRGQHMPTAEAFPTQNLNAMTYQGPADIFSSPSFPVSNGSFSPISNLMVEPGVSMDIQAGLSSSQTPTSPLPISPPGGGIRGSAEQEEQNQPLQHISCSSDEEMIEEEELEDDVDAAPKAPEKPTTPWECVHCTYVNPPGSHICEVCCKTSFNVDTEPKKKVSKVRRGRPQHAERDVGTSSDAKKLHCEAAELNIFSDTEKVMAK